MRRHSWVMVVLGLLLTIGLVLSACQTTSTPSAPTSKTEAKAAPTAEVKTEAKAVPKAEAKPAQADAKPAAPKDLPQGVGLGTHGVGGTFYAVGTGLAKVLSDRSPIKAIVKPTAGPTAYLPLLDSGELELGLPPVADAVWSYTGVMGYDKAYKNIRLLVRGHEQPTIPLVVRVDSGIKSIKELRGKRVSSEFGGSIGIRQNVLAGLESVGLTWKDVQGVPVADPASSIRALQEGRVDAAFGANATGAQHNEIHAATPLYAPNFADLDPEKAANPPKEMLETLRKSNPGATIVVQKKAGYLSADTTIISFATWLAASSKLSSDAAYVITKTIYENNKDLFPIHPLLNGWKQETMVDPDPVLPYHEGAIRFWKEKGLWTPAAEANQKKLLGQ